MWPAALWCCHICPDVGRKVGKSEVEECHLTVVPGIPNALDEPASGSNDTEDTCHPMTTIEDADRLDDTRGPGTGIDLVGDSVRTGRLRKNYLGIPRILKIEEDQGGGQNRARRRNGHVNGKEEVPPAEEKIEVWELNQR